MPRRVLIFDTRRRDCIFRRTRNKSTRGANQTRCGGCERAWLRMRGAYGEQPHSEASRDTATPRVRFPILRRTREAPCPCTSSCVLSRSRKTRLAIRGNYSAAKLPGLRNTQLTRRRLRFSLFLFTGKIGRGEDGRFPPNLASSMLRWTRRSANERLDKLKYFWNLEYDEIAIRKRPCDTWRLRENREESRFTLRILHQYVDKNKKIHSRNEIMRPVIRFLPRRKMNYVITYILIRFLSLPRAQKCSSNVITMTMSLILFIPYSEKIKYIKHNVMRI